ncbi:MAG: hypothetical protein VYA34_11165, partial [Myxococcota bacterium]|nr:hypothetical protein [Myxococcota bacterium]
MNWFTCSGGPILDRPILKLFPPVLLICFLLGIGCTEPFDSVRNPGPKLTLGEELYRVFCQRLAVQSFPADFTGELTSSTCLFGEEPPSDAAPAFKTLHSRRPKLIRAFELVLADSVGTDMNELLQKLVPLYDQGIVQAQAHAVGDFAQLMSESALVLEGLEWVSNRDGYRPVEVANGLAAPLLDYPNMSQFLDTFLNTVFSTDDLRPIWNVLARSLGGELRSRAGEPEMIDKDFQRLLSDFLLWEDSRFSEGRRLFAVQRDPRGVVRVSGETAADWEVGFADTDFDGNPDVDQWGRFTDSQGEVLGFGSPFPSENSSASDSRDNHGRLMNQAGGYVYRYFDSLNTTTAGVLHEATRLIDYDPELPLELMAGIGPWLGERSDKTLTLEDGTQLPYLGVNTSTSPILDFVHASTFLLNSSEVISLSELLLNIVKEEPILLAKNVDVIRDLFDRLDVPPFNEIELNANHQLVDELLVILKEIALVPGLLEDLVSALGSEKGRKLGDYFGRYMKYRDKVDVL